MEGFLNLLPIYIDDQKHDFDLNEFLETCTVHQSFDVHDVNDSESKHALGVMNSKLNDAETRIVGAHLLDVFVSQCGTDVFTSNCVSWTQQVFKILQGSHTIDGTTIACQVLKKLVANSSQFSELSRQLSTSIISQLVNVLCDEKHQKTVRTSEAVLECLKSTMEHYHSACGPLKGTIEKFLLHFVDLSFMVPESSVQSLWAQCFALIPRLGGSGNQGAQHKTNWIELYSLVLGSLQRSVDSMFKHVDELKVHQPLADSLKIPELTNANPLLLLQAERRRFLNLCTALTHLIKDTFTTTKTIPIDQLLEMISRLLSFNSKSLTKSAHANFERLTLGSIVPDLQMAALELLTSVIGVCRGQLITRAAIVTNYFVQILQWTFTPIDRRRVGSERPYGKLRIKAYQTLSIWLTVSRSACCFAKYSDALFTQLLSDIAVHKDTVQLMTASSQQSSSKKGKKLLDAPTLIVHKVDPKANADVCHAALQCLSSVLLYCGPRIKPATHKETQELTLSVLIDIMRGVPLKALLPYSDPRCRAGLYAVLQRLILCANPQFPAPLNYASAIFNIGLNDPCLDVSNVCAEGLVSMQSLLRPRGPTLNFALDKGQVKSALEAAPLMSSLTYSKPVESYSAAPAALPAPAPIPSSMTLPMFAPKPAEAAVETISREALTVIESRKENETPEPAREFETPPGRVSTIVTESPAANVERVMTRKEALKVIAANKPKEAKAEPKSPEEGKQPVKRPASPETSTKPPQEKILKELPYGTDEVDDDLEAMLASFRDVPA